MLIYLLPFLLAAFFSVLYKLDILKNNTIFYAVALFSLSIFSGFRFEVGPSDWMAYRQFFDTLNLDNDVFNLYQSKNQQFEIGYYCINYLIKYLGGDYSIVFLVASFFLSYALYKFTDYSSINKFYILTIYIGYSYIILNFAQVRQSIAVGFFILGCNCYLRSRDKFLPLIIASFGLLFQYSSIMYIAVLAGTIFFPEVKRRNLLKIFFVAGLLIFITIQFTSFYSIFIQLFPESIIGEKIAIYQDNLSEQGSGQIILAGYFFLLSLYLIHNLTLVEMKERFILYYAIYISFLACLSVLIFPGIHVMFSRILSVAAIFHAFAFALLMERRNNVINLLIFMLTTAIGFVYLYRLIYFYEDEYIPYYFNTFLFS